ncbi:MAG: DNA-formamidopyrimidine glycosylase family protein [Rectinema sp.]
MFELPEYVTLAAQISGTLQGKVIKKGLLGNSPHKFVWYNTEPEEFASLTEGKKIGAAYSKGRWLFVPLNNGHVLVLGECGGKILYHDSLDSIPGKYHLLLTFDDATAFSAMTQMWGAMEIFKRGEELKRQYIRDMRPTPVDSGFTFEYFSGLIDDCVKSEKRSVKGLLTQDQLIPGLGNAIAQDIMFTAKLHPKHPIASLDKGERRRLFDAIGKTLDDAIKKGGRSDEYDLFGKPGKYERILSRETVGRGCPGCGSRIERIQYLGGASCFCPECQT